MDRIIKLESNFYELKQLSDCKNMVKQHFILPNEMNDLENVAQPCSQIIINLVSLRDYLRNCYVLGIDSIKNVSQIDGCVITNDFILRHDSGLHYCYVKFIFTYIGNNMCEFTLTFYKKTEIVPFEVIPITMSLSDKTYKFNNVQPDVHTDTVYKLLTNIINYFAYVMIKSINVECNSFGVELSDAIL